MKKFNEFDKVNENEWSDFSNKAANFFDKQDEIEGDSGNIPSIFSDIEGDIDEMEEVDANEYLQSIIDYCQSKMV